jgi:hypothetical protein
MLRGRRCDRSHSSAGVCRGGGDHRRILCELSSLLLRLTCCRRDCVSSDDASKAEGDRSTRIIEHSTAALSTDADQHFCASSLQTLARSLEHPVRHAFTLIRLEGAMVQGSRRLTCGCQLRAAGGRRDSGAGGRGLRLSRRSERSCWSIGCCHGDVCCRRVQLTAGSRGLQAELGGGQGGADVSRAGRRGWQSGGGRSGQLLWRESGSAHEEPVSAQAKERVLSTDRRGRLTGPCARVASAALHSSCPAHERCPASARH